MITRLIEVSPDAGWLKVLPFTRSLWGAHEGAWRYKYGQAERKWSDGNSSSSSQKAIRFPPPPCPALIGLLFHSHLGSPLGTCALLCCGTSSHPVLSRCWANHLHLSGAFVLVTCWSMEWNACSHISQRWVYNSFLRLGHWSLLGLLTYPFAL